MGGEVYANQATGFEGGNDLWRFDPAANEWTWMSGSATPNALSVYGALDVSSATPVPGARVSPNYWLDPQGNLWLMGGVGYPASAPQAYLDDV